MSSPHLQLRLAVTAGWMNRNQQDVIDDLLAENRVLREPLGRRRLASEKYDGTRSRKSGRPKTVVAAEQIVLTMARENNGWGYTRIRRRPGQPGSRDRPQHDQANPPGRRN